MNQDMQTYWVSKKHRRLNLTIQAVTKSPIHVPTAAIFMKLSFLMPMYSVTMWGLHEQERKGRNNILDILEGSKIGER